MDTSLKISPELAAQPVCDGSRVIGHVVERSSGQIEAAPLGKASLGLFNSMAAAIHAILAARVDG